LAVLVFRSFNGSSEPGTPPAPLNRSRRIRCRRFSQPLGGFMADPSLRPCFMPLPSLGCLSLQSLASQRSRTRLRVACSLAVIPARPARADAALSPRVSPTPAPSLGPLPVSPRGYESPFGAPTMAGTPPGDPGPRTASSRSTTRIIRFEASFPLQSPRCGAPRVSSWEQPCSPGRSAPPESSPPAPKTL
jgi:hypothetical protein